MQRVCKATLSGHSFNNRLILATNQHTHNIMAYINLKLQWDELKSINPKIRIRNAASILNVKEVELLATIEGDEAVRLKPKFIGILERIEELGYVMGLTRNNDVVHERKGVYLNGKFGKHVSLFVGADIDQRMFLSTWAHAFSVTEYSGKTARKSFQFFSHDGEAVHKIFLTPKSNEAAFKNITEVFKAEVQNEEITILAKKEIAKELSDSEINADDFQQEWRNLKDTHEFYGLLGKYKLTRTQALRLAPKGDYAIPVDNKVIRILLEKVSEYGTEIMCFVGNQGNIQIHTGPVKKLLEYGEWYNIMDPKFNLHVNETAIHESWIVRKPTEDGTVTSLEIFNKEGNMMVQFFGKRKPGIPELDQWRDVIKEVENELIEVGV